MDDRLSYADRAGTPPTTVPLRTTLRLIRVLVIAGLIFLAVRSVAQSYRVEGTSMSPTLQPGQLLLINKAAYWGADGVIADILAQHGLQSSARYLFGGPERGDMLVFHSPIEADRDLIKRIIGLPGDTVVIRNGQVSVNGRRWDEPYLRFRFPDDFTYPESGQPLKVPDGSYFVLGDNRLNSFDSHLGWFVPAENLVGRAWLSYWPPTTWGVVAQPAVEEAPDITRLVIERSPSGQAWGSPVLIGSPTRREVPPAVAATVSALATALSAPATPTPQPGLGARHATPQPEATGATGSAAATSTPRPSQATPTPGR